MEEKRNMNTNWRRRREHELLPLERRLARLHTDGVGRRGEPSQDRADLRAERAALLAQQERICRRVGLIQPAQALAVRRVPLHAGARGVEQQGLLVPSLAVLVLTVPSSERSSSGTFETGFPNRSSTWTLKQPPNR